VHGLNDQAAIRAHHLDVRYGATVALQDVSVAVDPGELVALVGPNGAGKSSLLRALLGLIPYDGDVVLHGRPCRRGARTNVAFVAQRHDVDAGFPITVGQLVASGRRPFRRTGRRPGATDRHAVAGALARVGLDGLERRPIGTLSGGQLQRGFLARALAQEASVLLLDEPLAGLDAASAAALLDLLADLCDDGAAALVCMHDLALVRARFARCVALQRTVVGDGSPDDVLGAEGLERLLACSTG
jgi:ABC-type Mn2+/Zn2+ transport system ATPase subunit